MKIKRLAVLPLAGLLLGSSFLSGCSLSMFGDGKDAAIKKIPTYRPLNPECSKMELGPELTGSSMAALLHCFNAYGGLDAIDKLFGKLTVEQQDAIAALANKHILADRKLLFSLETTFDTLKARGTLDSTLQQLGRLTENEEFITSSIGLLKDGYFVSRADGPDRMLLKALERVSEAVQPSTTSDALDAGLTLAVSDSFKDLQSHFTGSPNRPMELLTREVLAYLNEQDPEHVEAGRELIGALINGDLFVALDEVLGRNDASTAADQESLKKGIPAIGATFRALLKDDARAMDGLTSLLHYARKPITCMSGGATVPDPAMFMFGELFRRDTAQAASFIQRDNPLMLAGLNSLCSFPEGLGANYPVMSQLASTTVIRPMTDLIKAFYRIERMGPNGMQRPMADLLIRILADTGSGVFASENTSGLKHLLPTLAELDEKDAWSDLLLVTTLMPVEQREKLADALQFLVEPTVQLGHQSVYDVLTRIVGRTDWRKLAAFISSLSRFTEAREPLLAPALGGLREAFYANDVHPLLDLVREIMKNAQKNEKVFTTLFEISEMPEFAATIKLTSEMSKDGRMRDLIGAMLKIFHKYALEGKFEIREAQAPAFEPKRRHNLRASDLEPFEVESETSTANGACLALDLRVKLSETSDPRFASQFENILSCKNSDGQSKEFVEALSFLNDTKTEDGRSVLAFQMDLMKSLNLQPNEAKFLVDSWVSWFDDGRFHRLLEAVPFWISQQAGTPGPVLRPLFDLFRPIMNSARAKLGQIEDYGARVLRRADIPQMIAYGKRLWNREADPILAPPVPPTTARYDMQAIYDALEKYECDRLPKDPVEREAKKIARAAEIVADYEQGVNGWELVGGHARRSWNPQEFRKWMDPVVEKLADPKQSDSKKKLLSSMLNVMRYFTLAPGQKKPTVTQHYTADYLRKWLHERSQKTTVIPYFYHNEAKPRVRLVNDLDRFELVLLNADFVAPLIGKNYALQFLTDIGRSWGDEKDPALWPPQIRAEYDKDDRPPTLKATVEDIQGTQDFFSWLVGDPDLPECGKPEDPDPGYTDMPITAMAAQKRDPEVVKRIQAVKAAAAEEPEELGTWTMMQNSLFNTGQLMPILYENLPTSKNAQMAGGLKVFRDLFFEIHYSTPEDQRGAGDGWKNNLSAALSLVRLGIMRQAGRYLRLAPTDDPVLKDFIDGLVHGAVLPDTERLLQAALGDERHPGQDLIFKAVDEIFKVQGARDEARLRQVLFYAVAMAKQLGLIDPSISVAAAAVEEYRYTLTQHVDVLPDLLRSQKAASLIRVLYEDTDTSSKAILADIARDAMRTPEVTLAALGALEEIDADPKAAGAFKDFTRRMDAVTELPAYQSLAVGDLLGGFVDFFAETGADPDSRAAAQRIRLYLADQLAQHQFEQLMKVGGKNPDDLYQVLETLSHSIRKNGQEGELQELLRAIRRTLSGA